MQCPIRGLLEQRGLTGLQTMRLADWRFGVGSFGRLWEGLGEG